MSNGIEDTDDLELLAGNARNKRYAEGGGCGPNSPDISNIERVAELWHGIGGPWPRLRFQGGFVRYVLRRFALGLEVAFAVLLAGTMIAADMAGCPVASALAGAALVVGAWAGYEGHRGNGRLRLRR